MPGPWIVLTATHLEQFAIHTEAYRMAYTKQSKEYSSNSFGLTAKKLVEDIPHRSCHLGHCEMWALLLPNQSLKAQHKVLRT